MNGRVPHLAAPGEEKEPNQMNRRDGRSGPRSRWRAVALGGVIAAFAACGPAIPAMAASPATPTPTPTASASGCNAVIIDSTAGHVLAADSGVTKAATQLEDKGADVRIRVLATAPDGSLDAYEAAQIAACPSWALNDAIKPNLLVFLVSMDHQDAVFYGKNYSRLQGQVDQIRADMGGDFRAGDFAGGIAKAEQETYGGLYPSGTPAWLVALIVVGIIVVAGLGLTAARGGGGSYGRGGYTYINAGNSWGGGGGFSSGGGSGSGGSSGSW
jgi:hypothetical protein